MSDLRQALSDAREAYIAQRYEGDLAEVAEVATAAAQRRRRRRRAAICLAIAASALVVVSLPTDEQPPEAQVAVQPPASHRQLPPAALRISLPKRVLTPPSVPPTIVRRKTNPVTLGGKTRRWTSALAFARPTRTRTAAAATGAATQPTPRVASGSAPRDFPISVPSVGLRSLDDAISLGT